jgi:hypothetical protein
MPTTRFHSKWLERALNGVAPLDLDGSTDIRLGIVTESSINEDTNNLYSGLTPVGTATGWSGPLTLGGVTAALSSGNWVFDANDPSAIAQDAGGFSNARSVIIYENTTGYILYSHTEDSTFGNVAGPLTLNFHANGLLRINI